MSWRAVAWAKKQRTGLPGAKATLVMLADYANKAGVAWPSQQQLADDTEQSVDSVQRHIQLLEQLGLISIRRRPGLRGQWPSLEYRLPVTGPHHAVRTEPHHAARTMPQMTPSPSRTMPLHRAAPCGTNLQENRQEEPLGPHSARPEPTVSKVLEEEPSGSAVPNLGRRRPEEGQQATEERKKREETYEELQRRHPGFLPRLKRLNERN